MLQALRGRDPSGHRAGSCQACNLAPSSPAGLHVPRGCGTPGQRADQGCQAPSAAAVQPAPVAQVQSRSAASTAKLRLFPLLVHDMGEGTCVAVSGQPGQRAGRGCWAPATAAAQPALAPQGAGGGGEGGGGGELVMQRGVLHKLMKLILFLHHHAGQEIGPLYRQGLRGWSPSPAP